MLAAKLKHTQFNITTQRPRIHTEIMSHDLNAQILGETPRTLKKRGQADHDGTKRHWQWQCLPFAEAGPLSPMIHDLDYSSCSQESLIIDVTLSLGEFSSLFRAPCRTH